MVVIKLRLPGRPDAVRAARSAVDRLRNAYDDEVIENLRLLVSEVVTNSIRYGPVRSDRGCIELTVHANPEALVVEVEDPGNGFRPDVRPPEPEQTSGWGLFLVDRLASRWGVSDNNRTKVWFELPSGDASARN